MKRFLAALWFSLWATAASAGVPCTLPFTLTNGTIADASQVMANYNAIISCLTSAAAAGANSDITSLSALSTPIPPSEGGTFIFSGGTSTGSANAQVVASTTPTNFTLTNNYTIVFKAGFTNTAATQFNINATGLFNVFRMTPSGPQALTGGEIVQNDIVVAIWDGTEFQLLSRHTEFGGFGPTTSIASAATTDLGTLPSHNALITGTTTITSFGASASLTYPSYQACFNGVLTLTFNATSLILPASANITTAANDCAELLYLGTGNWQVSAYQKFNGGSVVPTTAPNIQVFTTGTSLTYTTPTNAIGQLPLYIRVREVGGGGGGGAQSTNNGAVGTDSSFASWTAIHGSGGGVAGGNNGGAGGTGGVNGTGTPIRRLTGEAGNVSSQNGSATGTVLGTGIGGSTPFGGAGVATTAAGGNAVANTGSGGGGGSGVTSGAGGGAAEFVEFIIPSPVAASYTYTVGTGGAGGAAGGAAGGNGAAGRIEVEAYWQ